MKIAIYSRKSKFTGKGESIENQIEMCKAYIQTHFEGEHEIFVYEDEGFSGGNIDRPQFKQCINDITKNKFNVLICYRLDRISRNVADFSSTLELLERNNVSFVSIKEQFDTSTPIGRAMLYIASVFAQLERETIAERIRDNMLQLAKTGRWLGGITPTGFESTEVFYEDIHGNTKKAFKLSPIKDEIKLVKLIFNKYLELKSLTQLEFYLLQQNITTKNNATFGRYTLKAILQNPVYAIADNDMYEYFKLNDCDLFSSKENFDGIKGIMAYSKTIQHKNKAVHKKEITDWIITVGQHEGIIKGRDWIKVQELIEQNRSKTFRKVRNQDCLLSGIIRCGKCGDYMRPKMGRTLKNGERAYYYVCQTKEISKRSKCNCSNAPSLIVDKMVVDFLKEQALNKSQVKKLSSEVQKNILSSTNTIDDEKEKLNQQIAKNEKQIQNLVSSLSLVGNSEAGKYIIEQINNLDNNNAELKEKLYDLNQHINNLEYEQNIVEIIEQNISSFVVTFDSADSLVEKRDAIKRVVDKVIWDGEILDIVLIGSSHASFKKKCCR